MEVPAPVVGAQVAPTPRSFNQRRKPDYSEQDTKNRQLGRAGEELVLQFERDWTTKCRQSNLQKILLQ